MDQDETWHAGSSRHWPYCVRWGPISPPQRGTARPIFGPCLLWPNGWMDQDATWLEGKLCWLSGPVVEHRSLADVLSLSCARPVADG